MSAARIFRPFYVKAGFHAYEPEPLVPELSHLGHQWAPASLVIDPHDHDRWEIYLQVTGRSTWTFGEEKRTLSPGQGYVMPPNARHGMPQAPGDEHEYFFAVVDLGPSLARVPEIASSWRVDDRSPFVDGEHLDLPFRHLVREVALDGPYRASILRGAVDQLVLAASRARDAASTRPVPEEQPLPAVALAARDLIDRSPHLRWSLRKLSRAVGASESHLSMLFSEAFGRSPYQYVLYRRIEVAKERLRYSEIPVTRIALELGFSTSQHFANVFRRTTGIAPSSWRRRQRSAS